MISNKKLMTLLFVGTLICAGAAGYMMKLTFAKSAQDREAISTLTSVMDAQEVYFKEYKSYADEGQKMGFVPESKFYQGYFKKADVPEEFVKLLPEAALPYASTEGFRALLAVKNEADQKTEFWFIDETKQAQKLKISAPL